MRSQTRVHIWSGGSWASVLIWTDDVIEYVASLNEVGFTTRLGEVYPDDDVILVEVAA